MKNIEEFFRGKRILVTGGTGSIGGLIVKELLKLDIEEVYVLSRDEIKHFLMKKIINDKRLKSIIGDVRDFRSLEKVFENNNFDIVYHAAAMKHVVICEEFPIEAVKTNIIGTQNIVDLVKKYGVSKLINISTDKSVNPYNVMGASKFISERIVLNANYTSIRLGNVANTRGSVIPVLIEEMIKKKQITITDPNATRFLIRTSDAVKFILKATYYAEGGDIFVPKMKAFKLSDLVEILLEYIAPKLNISPKEMKINTIGLVRGEKLHEDIIHELEIPYVHSIEDFYVIKPKIYTSKIHTTPLVISSRNAEIMSKEELKNIVEEYLDTFYTLSSRNVWYT
jgi:FlaA1/EpsC-like NDP-sugar epimerase